MVAEWSRSPVLSEVEAQNYHKIGLCQQWMVDKYRKRHGKAAKYRSIFVSEC